MFGRGKAQALEAKINELKGKLASALKEKDQLKQELESSRQKVADLESRVSDLSAKIADTDVEQTRKQLESSIAEYTGLKELYAGKIEQFNASHEEKEQEFARQAAVERYNLDNEIKENRQANQDYVSSTVKSFSESYNYYLHQIKLLMDALGDVATRTGEALFSEPNEDLKAKIGQQMAEKLKAETDPLRTDTGNVILIGTVDKPEEAPAEEIAEEPACEAGPEQEPECEAASAEEIPEEAECETESAEEIPEEPQEEEEPPEDFPEDAILDAGPEDQPEEESEEVKPSALLNKETWEA